jgi:hypothetical protein
MAREFQVNALSSGECWPKVTTSSCIAFSTGPEMAIGPASTVFCLGDEGKIVEHWEVVQRIPEASANANSMF